MTSANCKAMLRSVALILFTALSANQTPAQSVPRVDNSSPSNAGSATDALRTIDQLVEQNKKLEQQNQELMKQIEKLRGVIAAQSSAESNRTSNAASADAVTAGAASSSESAARPIYDVKNTAASGTMANSTQQSPPTPAAQQATSGQLSTHKQDDKTELPEASNGNSAIFGEFNPGRGFTVAQGELGNLNLSGYMAVRYLNQFPGTQSATDHLGRPIPVSPRQDFQFHRVMLFSQGWLFSTRFQYSTFVWTVQDTNQVAVGGALYYSFGKFMTLGGGWNAYPGTMSLQGSHPVLGIL